MYDAYGFERGQYYFILLMIGIYFVYLIAGNGYEAFTKPYDISEAKDVSTKFLAHQDISEDISEDIREDIREETREEICEEIRDKEVREEVCEEVREDP